MEEVKVKKNKMGLRESKELEIALATADSLKASIDYIACCDYPELLEEEVQDE